MTVHLVGGGCARPLWFTLEARETLAAADHLVYDSLVHPDLLQLAPPGCPMHWVGKRKGEHARSQEEINTLLVRLGRSGGEVVRLKGGDPFVFGRGGEEALALQTADIPWRYVPGITAAIGALGSAGIPATHRGLAGSCTVATAHRQKWAEPDQALRRWLATAPGTLALYMGASSWGETAAALLEAGMPGTTPCSAVTWGGWGRATRTDGDLEGMAAAPLESPSIIVTGDVAGLPLHPERGPLQGLQVAVVRPFPESWETARVLERLGADAYSVPLLYREEIRHDDEEALLTRADWIVLSSPRGAQLLTRDTDPRQLGARIAVIGAGTARALQELGIRPDRVAEPPTSAGLARLLAESVAPGEEVLFFRNERGASAPLEAVRQRRAEPRLLPAYRMNRTTPPGLASSRQQWTATGLDAVVFGSSALVEAWMDELGPLPGRTGAVGWGPVCADQIEKTFGVDPLTMEEPALEGLIEILTELRKTKEEQP
ncbi:MAG: uroporphyrinogen-III C-methyltransferase [Synergistales bacterium]|nr:uroporphyrinogen-III C-methyltransferase [Synergistales bacterium]